MNDERRDLLGMDRFNKLPHPLCIRMLGGWEWPLELVCVETGLLKFYVSGRTQNSHFSDVVEVIDADGNRYDADTFYSDYIEEQIGA